MLFKRNAKGIPIFWEARIEHDTFNRDVLVVEHGVVGKPAVKEYINTKRSLMDEMRSMIKDKYKIGYKRLQDLYDNAPETIPDNVLLVDYLNTYLPKSNTHGDGTIIPMLCKTLEDHKPFDKGTYFAQWKINGERCIVTATKSDDLFGNVTFRYYSRHGEDWTPKLEYMNDIIRHNITPRLLDMMLEEGVALDGELYLPGYGINEINSFIKNTTMQQHYKLQYWVYDIAIEETTALARQELLRNNTTCFLNAGEFIRNKEDHLNNTKQFVILPNRFEISSYVLAVEQRDLYIGLGFEGLVIREYNSEYQFGGKRNNSMLKFKKKYDGYFEILDMKEDKRGLPIYILKNDINNELFECTLNATQEVQRFQLNHKETIIGNKALVEYRERSGVKQVPFHAKIISVLL